MSDLYFGRMVGTKAGVVYQGITQALMFIEIGMDHSPGFSVKVTIKNATPGQNDPIGTIYDQFNVRYPDILKKDYPVDWKNTTLEITLSVEGVSAPLSEYAFHCHIQKFI